MKKVVKNKSVTEWVLVKVKSMMRLKMLVMRFNLNNKYKEIKMNKKSNKTEVIRIKNNKMIFKCKGTLKGKCMINKKANKMISKDKKLSKYQTNKWAKSTTKRDKKISKTNKAKLKVKDRQMSILMVSREDNNSWLIIKDNKTSNKEKVKKKDKSKMVKKNNKNKEVTGRITINKVKKSTNKTKMLKNMKETHKICVMKNNLNNFPIKKATKTNQANLLKMKIKWTKKTINRTASNLKKSLMKTSKEKKMNKFKLKTPNSQWKNNPNSPMRKKSKKNKLKIESNIKELTEDKIISSKIIILFMNKRIMINKIWVKANKMPKDLVKGKKVLESLFIL